ncbi:hypothetical protein BC827DRAFT_1159280 [Russula dissimulans]|nr:hypothetical protein BC827DRAFT_1159280 [Russula dissimulans]
MYKLSRPNKQGTELGVTTRARADHQGYLAPCLGSAVVYMPNENMCATTPLCTSSGRKEWCERRPGMCNVDMYNTESTDDDCMDRPQKESERGKSCIKFADGNEKHTLERKEWSKERRSPGQASGALGELQQLKQYPQPAHREPNASGPDTSHPPQL